MFCIHLALSEVAFYEPVLTWYSMMFRVFLKQIRSRESPSTQQLSAHLGIILSVFYVSQELPLHTVDNGNPIHKVKTFPFVYKEARP